MRLFDCLLCAAVVPTEDGRKRIGGRERVSGCLSYFSHPHPPHARTENHTRCRVIDTQLERRFSQLVYYILAGQITMLACTAGGAPRSERIKRRLLDFVLRRLNLHVEASY